MSRMFLSYPRVYALDSLIAALEKSFHGIEWQEVFQESKNNMPKQDYLLVPSFLSGKVS